MNKSKSYGGHRGIQEKGWGFPCVSPCSFVPPVVKNFVGAEHALSSAAGYEPCSHPPEIIFLLAVMIRKRDRHRRLAGAARYLRRMRVVGIGIGSGGRRDSTLERESGRRGGKLRALAAGHVASASDSAPEWPCQVPP